MDELFVLSLVQAEIIGVLVMKRIVFAKKPSIEVRHKEEVACVQAQDLDLTLVPHKTRGSLRLVEHKD